MLRRTLLLGAAVSAAACSTTPAPAVQTQVLVVATLHGAHQANPNYTYDHLYQRIAAFAPTAVGVEIRQEDITRGREYFSTVYPQEMVELATRYESIVTGIDWFGEEFEGRAVSRDIIREGAIKRLERAASADPADPTNEDAALAAAHEPRMPLIQTASMSEFNDGRYDELSRRFYARMAELYRGTQYQPLSDFYAARDAHIDRNAVDLVRANLGGRIALIVGADHRFALIDALTAALGAQVQLVPV